MTFTFSRRGLPGRERHLERALEILPGLMSWSLLVGLVVLALWKPRLAAVLIIAFELYWLLRLLYLTMFLILSHMRLSWERQTDWMQWVRALDALITTGTAHWPTPSEARLDVHIVHWMRHRDLRQLRESGQLPPLSRDVIHVVIFAVAKESRAIYEAGIRSLLEQPFPTQQMLVVLAVEERAPADIRADAAAVQREYAGTFLDFLVTIHPDGQPGEARVKGANVTFAAKRAAELLSGRGVAFDRVLLSCFDADTVVSSQYFACLTYHFMTCPERTRASFQPIPVYHNNIWEVPGFARVLDVGSSFFQLVEATNPEQLVTFSSHSMSFQALVDIGYWPVDMISDDSAIFWKAFVHYDGHYRVVPIYATVSMDVAASSSWRRTIMNVYKQKRRWAWGVENVPLVLRAFLRAATIPLWQRCKHAFKLLEGHVAWATWPLLLTIIGWLPALLAGREFSSTVLYYTAPRIARTIFSLASVSLLATILLSILLLPRPPVRLGWLRKLGHAFEWCLVPVIAIGFSAMPALDAQTRLMLGRYMEFWVTEKPRTPRPSAQAVARVA